MKQIINAISTLNEYLNSATDYWLDSFCNGYAKINIGIETGLMNRDGAFIIPPIYRQLFLDDIEKGIITGFNASGFWGALNLKNETLVPFEYDCLDVLDETFFGVCRANKYGTVNIFGNVIIPIEYDNLNCWNDVDFIVAKKNGKYGCIDIDNNRILDFIYDEMKYPIDDPLNWIPVSKSGKYFYVNKCGKVLLDRINSSCKVYSIEPFCNDMAVVSIEDKTRKEGLINRNGNFIIPPIYNYIRCLNEENLFEVNIGLSLTYNSDGDVENILDWGKCGIVDLNHNIIIPIRYKYLIPIKDGYIAQKNNSKMIIDKKGNIIIPLKYEQIYPYGETLLIVKKRGKYGIIDINDNIIVDFIYDYIDTSSSSKLSKNDWLSVKYKNEKFYIDSTGKRVLF